MLRAAVLTIWFNSLLVWLYVAARVVTNDYILFDPFVYSVPWLSFGGMGALTFMLSAFSMFVYLYLWGFSRDRALPQR